MEEIHLNNKNVKNDLLSWGNYGLFIDSGGF